MSRRELQREVEVALDRGINAYDPQRLAKELTAHSATTTTVDAETAAQLLSFIDENRDELAEAVTDEFVGQIDIEPTTTATDASGQAVAADGGSLVSEATVDTFYISVMLIDAFQLGRYVAGDIGETKALLAGLALATLLSVWFMRKYTISVEARDEKPY